MKAATRKVLATCFRHPARSSTLAGRPQNVITSPRRKWLIFGEFSAFLSDLEGEKNLLLPRLSRPTICAPHSSLRRRRTQSDLVLSKQSPYPLSRLQVLPSLKSIPLKTMKNPLGSAKLQLRFRVADERERFLRRIHHQQLLAQARFPQQSAKAGEHGQVFRHRRRDEEEE